jgi:hypothetical protein
MVRALFVFVGLLLLLSRCAYQPAICPAYQSAYIYDKDQLRKKFSYFVGDTAPKVYAANKSKFLVIEPTTYKKRERSLQTIEKVGVPVLVPDSLKPGYVSASELFGNAERNVNDSSAVVRIDTVAGPAHTPAPGTEEYKITKERELLLLKYDVKRRSYWVDTLGYNNEQDNYMWYLRHVLVLPDAKLANLEAQAARPKEEKSKSKKEGRGPSKKANKKVADSVAGFEGTTSATILPDSKSLKKAKKKKDKSPAIVPTPAKKEEEGDDGF